MKKIVYFITTNKSKFEEASMVLCNSRIELVQKDIRLVEPQTIDQAEVVVRKAEQAFAILQEPVIVDDTGIYFDEYKNFPGTNTKTVFQTIGFKGVERLLAGANRKAHFQTLLCYKDEHQTKVFCGVWPGMIVPRISKLFNPDWQYNSIFVPDGFGRPLSEISMEERSRMSHRKIALTKLAEYLTTATEIEIEVRA